MAAWNSDIVNFALIAEQQAGKSVTPFLAHRGSAPSLLGEGVPPEGVLPPGVGAGLQPHSENHMVINAVEVSAAKCMGRYHAPPTLGHNQNPSSLLL